MSASEIGDPKMDIKHGLSDVMTPDKLLQSN